MQYYKKDWIINNIKNYIFLGEEYIYARYYDFLKQEVIKPYYESLTHITELNEKIKTDCIIDGHDVFYHENINAIDKSIPMISVYNLFAEKGGIDNIELTEDYINNLYCMLNTKDFNQKNMAVSILFNLDYNKYKNQLKDISITADKLKNVFDSADAIEPEILAAYLTKIRTLKGAYGLGV